VVVVMAGGDWTGCGSRMQCSWRRRLQRFEVMMSDGLQAQRER